MSAVNTALTLPGGSISLRNVTGLVTAPVFTPSIATTTSSTGGVTQTFGEASGTARMNATNPVKSSGPRQLKVPRNSMLGSFSIMAFTAIFILY